MPPMGEPRPRVPFPLVVLGLIALTAGIAGIRAFASSRGPVEISGRGGAAGGASPSGPPHSTVPTSSASGVTGTNVYAATGIGMFSPAVAGVPPRVYVPNRRPNAEARYHRPVWQFY